MFAHRNKNGAVVLNGDDPLLNTIQDVDGTKPVRFGYGESCDVRVENVDPRGLLGTDFELVMKDGRISCHCDIPGTHGAVNAACAAATGRQLGLSDEQIRQGIASIKALPGRSNIIHREDHIILDDCYNANPVSMKAAIDMLSLWEGRKVALLGDMFELGADEESLHYGVGEYLAQKGIDLLLAVGKLSSKLADGAVAAGMDEASVIRFADTDEAKDKIFDHLKKGDALLIKASHGMHLEKVVSLF
jgi:UDP-N-acetylmuramoyl-tripeptide--D-alanyl-D-alanine ligase